MASVSVQDRWLVERARDDGVVEKVRTARFGRGKRYLVRWRDPMKPGAMPSKSFELKKDADAHAVKVEGELLAGSYVDPTLGKRAFRVYVETTYLTTANLDPSTRRLYARLLKNHIYPVLGDLPMGSVRHSQAQAAVTRWDRELGRNVARQCQALARAVFNMAAADEVIVRSPFAKIRIPKVYANPDRWMPESLDDVLPVLDVLPVDLETIETLAIGSGLRLSEMLALDVERDLTFLPKGLVVVQRQLVYLPGEGMYLDDPKTPDSKRTVPLPTFARDALSAWLRDHPPAELTLPWGDLDGEPSTICAVFHRAGKPMLRTTVTNRIRGILGRAELPRGATPHVMRHLYRSLLHDAGIPQAVIDRYMGHVSTGSVGQTVYTHVMKGAPERVRNALETTWHDAGVRQLCASEADQVVDQGI